MIYTAFNQNGRAIVSGSSVEQLLTAMADGGYRYYFVMSEANEVLANELKGKRLPKRTSHGTPIAIPLNR